MPLSLMIEQIVDLDLPSLYFHYDHSDHCKYLIKMQLVEMLLACSIQDCKTMTVLEHLVQMPSKKVRDALSSSVTPNLAVGLLGEIPDGGVHCVGTWSTLPSDLHRLAESSELLANRLHCEPKEGGFVTLNRWKALLGSKFGSFEDCLPKSPRSKQLDTLSEKLHALFNDDDDDDHATPSKENIIDLMKAIQGQNKSHYVHPEAGELASPAKSILTQWMATQPANHMFMIERTTIEDFANATEEDQR
jgi:hypothetical protein